MKTTPFFEDFISYYEKAMFLEDKNLGKVPQFMTVKDPLMDNITIYDTVHRRQAGFSKALEDIHGVRQRKDLVRYSDFSKKLGAHEFQFLHLFHRFTGSGASFQPTLLSDGTRNPKEHGYYNNYVGELAGLASIRGDQAIDCMREFIATNHLPMVTSVGNQPPSLKNAQPEKYRLAMQYYFDNFAKDFITDYMTFLVNKEYETNQPTGIKEAVDFCCKWHKARNFKQWRFVLTAFVMDTAEYYPQMVSQTSHCYYGANCIRGFDLMFTKEKSDPRNKSEYHEKCMTELCNSVCGRPYDVEDAVCDVIRYWVEYVPKGYSHLSENQITNNSTLKINGVYPEEIQKRISEIVK